MADETLSFPIFPCIEKHCRRCRKEKPLSEFHIRSGTGRHRAECKDCYREARTATRDHVDNRRRVKEWQMANPERKRAQYKRIYENMRGDLRRWIASNLRTTRAYCKKGGIPYAVTAEDIVTLYAEQDGRCALTGRELVFGSRGRQRDSLSIDRVDQTGGYVLGNIRLITYQANFARNKFSDPELFAFCEAVLSWHSAT